MTAAARPATALLGQWPARARRRLGIALLLFGLAGLALLAGAAFIIVVSLGSLSPLGGDLDVQRASLERSLAATSDVLAQTSQATEGLGRSVDGAARSAAASSGLAGELASTMRSLSAASNVSILGNQPFASLGAAFGGVAERSDALARELDQLSGSLRTNAGDASRVVARLGSLQAAVDDLRASVGTGSALGTALGTLAAARVVLVGLMAWLAVPAAVAVWLGLRLVRSTPARDRVPLRAEPTRP
ncbi:MAG TPA: hypothetical protein VIV06_00465 [Candidatus Limnocylindrales bacterium]